MNCDLGESRERRLTSSPPFGEEREMKSRVRSFGPLTVRRTHCAAERGADGASAASLPLRLCASALNLDKLFSGFDDLVNRAVERNHVEFAAAVFGETRDGPFG